MKPGNLDSYSQVYVSKISENKFHYLMQSIIIKSTTFKSFEL